MEIKEINPQKIKWYSLYTDEVYFFYGVYPLLFIIAALFSAFLIHNETFYPVIFPLFPIGAYSFVFLIFFLNFLFPGKIAIYNKHLFLKYDWKLSAISLSEIIDIYEYPADLTPCLIRILFITKNQSYSVQMRKKEWNVLKNELLSLKFMS